MVVSVVCRPVVEEASEHTASAAMLIDGQDQSFEQGDCVHAIRPNRRSAVFDVPDLEVATAPFLSASAECDLCRPLLLLIRVVCP